MTTLELKKQLVKKINEIDDISFLKAIKTILEARTSGQILTLTPEQRHEIEESKKEIEKGLYLNQEDIDKMFGQWVGRRTKSLWCFIFVARSCKGCKGYKGCHCCHGCLLRVVGV
jgi:hypothetical protein